MRSSSRHVPFEQLIDIVEGRLSLDEQVRMHLAMCPRCAAEVAWLEHTIGLMRTDDTVEPPARVADAISHVFRPHTAPKPASLRQRIVATLRFDSAQVPLPQGTRSGPIAERQLVYNAGEIKLDLRITPAGALWVVAGQVLGMRAPGQIELQGPTGTLHAALSDVNEFVLSPAPPDDYTLIVRMAEVEIVVAGLKVGA